MREDYVPNEKYRNMFGVERNGYGMERVDLYLAQLEVAFKKIREDNRNLKREVAEQAANRSVGLLPPDSDALAVLNQQEQYIAHMQMQLGEAQEQNQRLLEQVQELSHELSAAPAIAVPMNNPAATESLLAQINALRAEADELRQQLRRQQQSQAQPLYASPAMELGDQTSMIGKVLVEARVQAEETIRQAQQEADQLTRKARQRAEELRAEHERIYSQLQGISFALRTVLRDSAETEYKQRGEEFAAS